MHVVFAGGGAAGTWFSGLTVAHQLRARAGRARITFVGTGKDFESRNAILAGFQYHAIPYPPSGTGWGRAWRSLTASRSAYQSARRLVSRLQPDVVVGLGGVSAMPMVRAAIAADVAVALVEQNAVPGELALAYAERASVVFGGFATLKEHLSYASQTQIVGNAIRSAFGRVHRLRKQTLVARARDIRKGRIRGGQLVVLAGTAGDRHVLNEQIPKSLYKLRAELDGWKIVHQAGSGEVRATRLLYRKLGLSADVNSYIPDLPRVMLSSDLAIARPGGVTLFELAAAGVPAVLIPSEQSGELHQIANARAFEPDACRAVGERVDGQRLDDRLVESMREMVINPGMRLRMSAAMLDRACPHAARQVSSQLIELVPTKTLQHVA